VGISVVVSFGLILLGIATVQVAADNPSPTPAVYSVEVMHTYPHDDKAFTQGLFFSEGRLFESTGVVGESTLRQVNIRSGTPVRKRNLPDDVFGEGATAVGNDIISLTWKAGKGYVHDLNTLKLSREFSYSGEGWGLTYDGNRLIMSDGSGILRYLDPETFEETGTLEVTLQGEGVKYLNELEWVEDEILANVWMSDWILRINPETGTVTGLIDLSNVHPRGRNRQRADDVANGIAYEPTSKRLFLTGKNWPVLYEVKIVDSQL